MARARREKRVQVNQIAAPTAPRQWRTWALSTALLGLGIAVFALAWFRPAGNAVGLEPLPAESGATWDPRLRRAADELLAELRTGPADAAKYGKLGMIYESHGLSGLAQVCFRNATKLAPSEPRWWHLLGCAAANSQNVPEAERALRHVLTLKSDYAPTYERLGLILADRGGFAEAAQFFERVTRLAPREPGGYFQLASVRLQTGDAPNAITLLEKAAALAPERGDVRFVLSRAYRAVGRTGEAEAMAKRSSSVDYIYMPDPWRLQADQLRVSIAARLREAERHLDQNKPKEASQILEQLHRDDPTDVAVANNLSVALMQIGRLADARRVLEDILAKRPDYFPTHINLASVYIADGSFDLAVRHSEEAVHLAPQVAKSWFTRALVLSRLKRPDEAISACKEACRLDPRNFHAHAATGELLAQEKRWSESIGEYSAALNLNPSDAAVRYNLAYVYNQVGSHSEALQQLQEAARLEPANERIARAIERTRARLEGQP